MDTAHWPQDFAGLVKPMEELMGGGGTNSSSGSGGAIGGAVQRSSQVVERRVRPQKEQALNCPRCNSTNTKFCYYNNYSLTQPRYFCKTCRRYWTEGGTLRNVPVGGGSRKNKRSSSSSTSPNISSNSMNPPTINPAGMSKLIPSPSSAGKPNYHEGQDLNLAFSMPHDFIDRYKCSGSGGSQVNSPAGISAMELLRSGMNGQPMPAFLPMHNPGVVYPPTRFGMGMHEYNKPPSIGFPLEGSTGRVVDSFSGVQDSSTGRLLFPFEDLRQVPSSNNAEFDPISRGQGGDPPTFWNQMMGGGGGDGAGSGGGSW